MLGYVLILVLLSILASEFVNGWTDSPNAIATVVSSRVLKPRHAVVLATIGNIIGAFYGKKVAETIGTGIIRQELIQENGLVVIGAAMAGIIIWSTVAWYFGLPTSESHALVSGLAGAGLAIAGPSVLLWSGWAKVLIGLAFSTFLGFGGGWLTATLIRRVFRDTPRSKISPVFAILQIVSAAGMALSHGSNDGQKFIGIFTLSLVLGGVLPEFQVQWWTILLCSIVMGLGTSLGGWRIIKTMGTRMTRIEPYQGFAAESAAAGSILFASALGVPLSTTHTINTSIMGVSAATRFSAVRWGVVKELVTAWILTFPICAAIGFLAGLLLKAL